MLVMVLSAVMCLSAFACKKDDGKKPGGDGPIIDIGTEDESGELSLDVNEMSLVVGDSGKLTATYTVQDGATLSFESANTGVATVTDDGTVTAVSVGSSVITAKYGEQNATCTVSVNLGGFTPTLVIDNAQASYKFNVNDEPFAFGAKVKLGTKEFTDAQISFASSDTSVADFNSDKKLVAKKKGNTTVTVSAVWRGMSSQDHAGLSVSFPVEVDNAYSFSVNGETLKNVELYTVEQVDGISGNAKEVAFEPKIILDGQDYAAEVIFADNGFATYDSVNHKITATRYGSTTLTLKYVGEETFESDPVTVTVIRPTIVVSEEVEYFSAATGGWKDKTANYETKSLTTKLDGDYAFEDAYQVVEGREKPLTLDSGTHKLITGGLELDKNAVTTATVILGTTERLYKFTNVKAYGDILSTADDLKKFDRAKNDGNLEGYFILVNDVDMGGYMYGITYTTPLDPMANYGLGDGWGGGSITKRFIGTFNGQGHKITNFKGGNEYRLSYGFFGAIGDNSVIENVSFVQKADQYSYVRGLAVNIGSNVKIRNVSIEIDGEANQIAGIMAPTAGSGITLDNVTVKAFKKDAWSPAALTGSLFGGNPNYTANNVYVISNVPLASNWTTSDMHLQSVQYAQNRTKTDYNFGNYTVDLEKAVSGVKAYFSQDEMTADIANNDFSSFNNGNWHIENGIPVFGQGDSAYSVLIDGKPFNTSESFAAIQDTAYTVSVRKFAEAGNVTLECDDNGVTVSGKTFTLGAGAANSVSIKVKVDSTEVATININKLLPEVKIETPIEYYSVNKGKYIDIADENNEKTLESLLSLGSGESIVSTYVVKDGERTPIGNFTVDPFDIEKNKVALELWSAEKRYVFEDVTVYTDVIVSYDDIKQFNAHQNTTARIGYYVMVQDVINNSWHEDWNGGLPSGMGANMETRIDDPSFTNYFQGTFDGQGHIIKMMIYDQALNSAGLFGGIKDNSVVKNFGLYVNNWRGGVFLAHAIGNNVTIEDVYCKVMKIDGTTKRNPQGLASVVLDNLTMNNVVIDVAEEFINSWSATPSVSGSLFGGFSYSWRGNANKGKIRNTYVLTKYALAVGYINQGMGYAENETADTWEYTAGTIKTQFNGVKRYDDAAAMTADAQNNDLSSFENSEYWTVTGGVPVWHKS